MPLYSRSFNKQVTLAIGATQLAAILTAQGYNGTFNLSQLRITDLAGDSVVILTDTPVAPVHTTGEAVGAAGVSKTFHLDGSSAPIDATCVWIYQAAGHAITVNVVGY